MGISTWPGTDSLPRDRCVRTVAHVTDLDLADLAARASRAAQARHLGAVVSGLRPLPGGVSSLTYAATMSTGVGDREIVVKVAPPGLAPVRNRDVLRQSRALRRLAGVEGFPVPAVEFEDEGTPPEVPPLFAMELRAGDAYESALDVAPAPPDPATAAERMRVAARALARLQAWAPTALGFDDEPAGTLSDELERWRRLFATVDADIALGHEKLYARLAESLPGAMDPRVLHGDYRVANMLFVGARLEAVIDWEIWSVGDPRFDLAWLLMHADPAHVFNERRPPADIAAGSALPAAERLLEIYLAERGALGAAPGTVEELRTDLSWFLGVCFYKTASTIAVIHKRNRRRPEPDPTVTYAAQHLGEVLAAGHHVLDRR